MSMSCNLSPVLGQSSFQAILDYLRMKLRQYTNHRLRHPSPHRFRQSPQIETSSYMEEMPLEMPHLGQNLQTSERASINQHCQDCQIMMAICRIKVLDFTEQSHHLLRQLQRGHMAATRTFSHPRFPRSRTTRLQHQKRHG